MKTKLTHDEKLRRIAILDRAIDCRPEGVGVSAVVVGTIFRERRKAIQPRVTMRAIAERAGVTQAWLDRFERGRERPTREQRDRLNAVLADCEREEVEAFATTTSKS